MLSRRHPELLPATNRKGLNCCHIAAASGSNLVVKELVRLDKKIALIKTTNPSNALAIHLAAEHGHSETVRILLANGSPVFEETSQGMTFFHLAAKQGFTSLIRILPVSFDWSRASRKTGLAAVHFAALYAQVEMVMELLLLQQQLNDDDGNDVNLRTNQPAGQQLSINDDQEQADNDGQKTSSDENLFNLTQLDVCSFICCWLFFFLILILCHRIKLN